MATYNYAIYKFGNKRLAIQLPKGKSVEDLDEMEEGIRLLENLIDEYEETESFPLIEPISELSLNDFYFIREAILAIHRLSCDNPLYKDAFFHLTHKEYFEKMVNEADENFNFGMADIWIE